MKKELSEIFKDEKLLKEVMTKAAKGSNKAQRELVKKANNMKKVTKIKKIKTKCFWCNRLAIRKDWREIDGMIGSYPSCDICFSTSTKDLLNQKKINNMKKYIKGKSKWKDMSKKLVSKKNDQVKKELRKKLTINDFVSCIPWAQIEDKLGKRDYKKFIKFMRGQTCLPEGVYECDLAKFLKYEYQGKATPDILWD